MNHDTQPKNDSCSVETNGVHAPAASATSASPAAQAQPASQNAVTTPRFRATTTEDGVTLRVELPGVAPEGVSLTVEDGELQLDARQAATATTGATVLRQSLEFRLTDFRGRWRLPENVDADAITSTLRHGVLVVALPLKRPARRTIAIA